MLKIFVKEERDRIKYKKRKKKSRCCTEKYICTYESFQIRILSQELFFLPFSSCNLHQPPSIFLRSFTHKELLVQDDRAENIFPQTTINFCVFKWDVTGLYLFHSLHLFIYNISPKILGNHHNSEVILHHRK